MEITVAAQTWVFLGSIAIGALMGVLYDVFRISRLALRLSGAVIMVQDLLFCALCAIISYGYMLGAVAGQVRLFILIGMGIGAVLYFLTIGELVMRLSGAIIDAVRKIFRFIFRLFIAPFIKLAALLWGLLCKLSQKLSLAAARRVNKVKMRLKRRRVMLYNLYKQTAAKKCKLSLWRRLPFIKPRKENTGQ